MERESKQRFSPPAVGGTSLLVVFAVLCLTVFALLSLATVRSDTKLADASQRAVEEYYAADLQAQEILARLRAGETPDGVKLMGGDTLYAEYAPSRIPRSFKCAWRLCRQTDAWIMRFSAGSPWPRESGARTSL